MFQKRRKETKNDLRDMYAPRRVRILEGRSRVLRPVIENIKL